MHFKHSKKVETQNCGMSALHFAAQSLFLTIDEIIFPSGTCEVLGRKSAGVSNKNKY
jgi:hypothetical protein